MTIVKGVLKLRSTAMTCWYYQRCRPLSKISITADLQTKLPSRISFIGRYLSSNSKKIAATADTSTNASSILETPIVIVGGGPCGLLLSNLLSLYQVPSILVEGQTVEQRCSHPQAHFLNTRSMEILRNALPNIFSRVQEKMTPVDQWKYFQFGYDMLSSSSLARVIHPVDQPLSASVDANGKLIDETATTSTASQDNDTIKYNNIAKRPLSACTVGHLAQHTLCRILYEAAMENAMSGNNKDTRLYYNTRVFNIEDNSQGFTIQANNCNSNDKDGNNFMTVHAKVCIAADGAHSFCRNQSSWDIQQFGQVGIQHLLNIHVKTDPEWARQYLHDNGQNFAMLYSIFHPKIVAMVVCHSVGEYVFQVPFFPPYQSLEDYSHEQVQEMVFNAMGIDEGDDRNRSQSELNVVSVKAWTMSSLIADKYFYAANGCGYLVGDAAHVFPPAGGLGMNTGLQDVYTLAWKLAWAYQNNHLSSRASSLAANISSANTWADNALERTGERYQKERRPVAQANAALSVRNYNRLLEITKACYLSEQYPTLLIQTLEASSSLLPFHAQRDIFQKLVATATWTLSSLREQEHPYTQHLRNNIRRILASGGGLPLLFPRAELGFGYNNRSGKSNAEAWDRTPEGDTIGFQPQIQAGHLFPHIVGTVQCSSSGALKQFPNLRPLHETADQLVSISFSDLPAQVSRNSKPCFVLILLVDIRLDEDSYFMEIAHNLTNKIGIKVEVVEVLPSNFSSDQRVEKENNHLILYEESHPAEGFMLEEYRQSVWLIRPDGHVAGGCRGKEIADAQIMQEKLFQCASEALLGDYDSSHLL